MSPVYGANERTGLEGLDQIGEQQRRTSTPVTEADALVEIHIEWFIKWFTARGDVGIVPEWNFGGGAWTTDDNLP